MVVAINRNVRIGEERVRVVFEAVRQLALPVLLGVSFIDKYVWGSFSNEKKLYHTTSNRSQSWQFLKKHSPKKSKHGQ